MTELCGHCERLKALSQKTLDNTPLHTWLHTLHLLQLPPNTLNLSSPGESGVKQKIARAFAEIRELLGH